MWVVTGSLLFLRTRKQQADPTASSHVGRIFVPRYPSKGKAADRRKEQRKRTRPLRYFPKRANRVFRRAYGCCRSLGLAASRRQSKSGVTRVCVACVSTQHPYCPRQSPVLRDMLSPMFILRAPSHTASLHVGRLFCSRVSQGNLGHQPVTHPNESGLVRRDNLPTCEDAVVRHGQLQTFIQATLLMRVTSQQEG